jgi:hypothetical protein
MAVSGTVKLALNNLEKRGGSQDQLEEEIKKLQGDKKKKK